MALGLCLWLVWPAQSFARALVRFIHAVPGVGTATVEVNTGAGNVNLGSIGFAQVSPWRSIRSGSFRWELTGAGKVLASGTSTVGDGVYDIVVLDQPSGPGVGLGVYKAHGGMPHASLLRVIHAVPELGSPMIMLDSQTAARMLAYHTATPYISIAPGVHSLSAMKPSEMKPGDPTLVDVHGVHFAPGVAYSAIVVGSRGKMVRVVTVVDRGAPLTRAGATKVTRVTGKKTKVAKQPGMALGGHATRGHSMVVRSGDSLWTIARAQLPAGASNAEIWNEVATIWNRNKARIGTGDPNLVFTGTRLQLP